MEEKVSSMRSWCGWESPSLGLRQASSPPMRHYALGMDFPIPTRNTWKIHVLIGQITAFHVFKIYLNTAPAYMSEHFTPGSDIHNYQGKTY